MTELFKRVNSMFNTTAFRLAAGIVAVLLALGAVLSAVVIWQTNQVLTGQVVATLNAEASALMAEAKAQGTQGLIEAVGARSRPEGPGLYFLTDGAGRKLAGNLSRSPPEIVPGLPGSVFHYRPSLVAPQAERIGVGVSLAMPEGSTLIVGRDVDDQRAFANGIKRLFILGFGALTAAGLATALLISRIVLKRIETINIASREIMAGDLSRRIPQQGSGDELDGLASNLNAMLDRIEQLMTGLKEVSENIAHDLKTPLNRLRNRLEAALRDKTGSPAHQEVLARTIDDADDLIKTFNALLLIARLEANALDKSTEAVDCGALVRDVAELYIPVAEEHELSLDIAAAPGPIVTANRQLIGQAVANLIDNALKYAPAGKQSVARPSIAVAVSSGEGEVEITVADHGPGIAAADRDRVLKRFVRLDESRSQPGTGLGLSLVSAVARLHGGRVLLEDNAPGLKVRVLLPVRTASAPLAGITRG